MGEFNGNITEYLDSLGDENITTPYAVLSITFGRLVECGAFTWDYINWKDAAYDDAQYSRFCEYFQQRFWYREISMVPPRKWMDYLRRKLVFELMPKYRKMYEMVGKGIDPTINSDEYEKRREIGSDFPETLLSGNSDYASTGKDSEWERVRSDNIVDNLDNYRRKYAYVDELMGNELETMFTCMWSAYERSF